jgi:hypothetical protein
VESVEGVDANNVHTSTLRIVKGLEAKVKGDRGIIPKKVNIPVAYKKFPVCIEFWGGWANIFRLFVIDRAVQSAVLVIEECPGKLDLLEPYKPCCLRCMGCYCWINRSRDKNNVPSLMLKPPSKVPYGAFRYEVAKTTKNKIANNKVLPIQGYIAQRVRLR